MCRVIRSQRSRATKSSFDGFAVLILLSGYRSIKLNYDIEVEDIDGLLERDWHYRAWTFQEVILASNPIIVCGHKVIDWAKLQSGIAIFTDSIKATHPLWAWSFRKMGHMNRVRRSKGVKGREGHVSHSILAWRMLFQVWMLTPRPTHWNKKRLRSISNDAAVDIDRSSVNAYQEYVIKPGRFHRLQIAVRLCFLGAFSWTFVLGTILLFTFSARQGHRSVGLLCAGGLCLLVHVLNAIIFVGPWTVDALNLPGWKVDMGLVSLIPKNDASLSLRGMLQALRDRKAYEAKDLSFALYGVLQSLGVELRNPDYSEPLGSVYKNLLTSLVQWNPALINLLVDVGPTLPGTPSWVPDWSTVRKRKWLDLAFVEVALDQDDGRTRNSEFTIANDELIISGSKLASITWASPSFERISGHSGDLNSGGEEESPCPALQWAIENLSSWMSLLRRDIPIIEAYDSVPTTVFHILRGSTTGSTNATNAAFYACFRSLIKYASASNPLGPVNDSLSQSRMQAVYDELKQKESALGTLADVVNKMVQSKRVVFLADEHACSGPDHLAEGDELLILKGVSVPMIARRQGNSQPVAYTLLGPAYVPGLMGLLEWDPSEISQTWEEYRFQ